jgi:attachment p12 family protein
MTIDWQTAIAAILVFIAAVYLVRRGWRTIAQKRAGCGMCSNCPTDQNPAGKPLVPIDVTLKTKLRP